MKKLIITEFFILLAGTLFAWTNFGIELNDWLNKRACTTGCAQGLVNPFLTPCFYGACFFLLAFIISTSILRKFNQANIAAPRV
ncbi:MAG: hypothetical protein C3F02_04080 [Parcubacteria group bacterium]|nr:MAG: hypothetical protein C3F02_04080 [Parcubacteria group bacterium]